MFTVEPTHRTIKHSCAAMHLLCRLANCTVSAPVRWLGMHPTQLSSEHATTRLIVLVFSVAAARPPWYSAQAREMLTTCAFFLVIFGVLVACLHIVFDVFGVLVACLYIMFDVFEVSVACVSDMSL